MEIVGRRSQSLHTSTSSLAVAFQADTHLSIVEILADIVSKMVNCETGQGESGYTNAISCIIRHFGVSHNMNSS